MASHTIAHVEQQKLVGGEMGPEGLRRRLQHPPVAAFDGPRHADEIRVGARRRRILQGHNDHGEGARGGGVPDAAAPARWFQPLGRRLPSPLPPHPPGVTHDHHLPAVRRRPCRRGRACPGGVWFGR